MELKNIDLMVKEFIENDFNECIKITGNWGVGKTYFWHQLYKKYSGNLNKEKFSHYSYLPLFGINDIEELKLLLFTSLSKIGEGEKKNSFFYKLKSIGNRIWNIPKFKEFGSELINTVAFSTVNEALICFDDLERIGSNISYKELFGLISYLKEQCNCKIALILNEDAIYEDKLIEFKQHGEKVIDREILFSRSTTNAIQCIFETSSQYHPFIEEFCVKLSINNLRILQRIKRSIIKLNKLLNEDNRRQRTIRDVYQSLILFTFCKYTKESEIPTLEYIRDIYNPFSDMMGLPADSHESEENWIKFLREYEYDMTDDLDKEIMDFITFGFFDENSLLNTLNDKDQWYSIQEGMDSYYAAWDMFHNSFKNNEQEFVSSLLSSFHENIQYFDLSKLYSVTRILRSLGYDKKADLLIDKYVETHEGDKEKLDINTHYISGKIDDEYLVKKCNVMMTKETDDRTVRDVLKKVAAQNGWGGSDEEFLGTAPEAEYYEFFKSEDSEELKYCIDWCLRFGKIGSPNKHQKHIYNSARNALVQISKENNLNYIRVKVKFGIDYKSQ